MPGHPIEFTKAVEVDGASGGVVGDPEDGMGIGASEPDEGDQAQRPPRVPPAQPGPPFTIRDCDVVFPAGRIPFAPQFQVMTGVLTALKAGVLTALKCKKEGGVDRMECPNNALLESPTGGWVTVGGCASCGWHAWRGMHIVP